MRRADADRGKARRLRDDRVVELELSDTESAMHVLIVDDQQSARLMLRRVVEDLGADLTVEDYADPVQALRRSEECEPDLLLLDYRMPEMDGLEFERRFRRLPANRDVPIVLISVVGDEPVRQAALEAGVID